ncbi:MAG TPA: ergothioneine biosynthesis protein EgtB [bacterium]|nr:ergothioneine biosynthesis protein EgtB [bacterium]
MRIQAEGCPRGAADLQRQFREIRRTTLEICEPLEPDDYGIQSMADVSPPKWHLAHSTWFFETFLLQPHLKDYRTYSPAFAYLFNSYYKSLGDHQPRPERGLLSRPTLREVLQYRTYVDDCMEKLFEKSAKSFEAKLRFPLLLGCHHEQQHQELLLMDILHNFFSNPLRPVYREPPERNLKPAGGLKWKEYAEGLREIGFAGTDFAYDNEGPRHRVFLEAFRLASRPVTQGEFLEFIGDGGYSRPALWLSDGWDRIQAEGWRAPLYWEKVNGAWHTMSLNGRIPLELAAPVSHLSYYEAEAYAHWAGKRLPTEAEWEVGAQDLAIEGNFLESGNLRPVPAPAGENPAALFGDVWEWTASAYLPYPGFKPMAGNFAEYNGKFMVNQMVLRGGSCLTPQSHIRASYRNFFPPSARWACSGLRLAEDL